MVALYAWARMYVHNVWQDYAWGIDLRPSDGYVNCALLRTCCTMARGSWAGQVAGQAEGDTAAAVGS